MVQILFVEIQADRDTSVPNVDSQQNVYIRLDVVFGTNLDSPTIQIKVSFTEKGKQLCRVKSFCSLVRYDLVIVS